MKAILSFFDFWTIFCCFFFFFFIFALTFHKCQIVKKAFLSFFSKSAFFPFHFCFDLPQVSNCYESDSFIFDFWTIFCCFFFLFIFALTFHKCQIVKKAFLSFFFQKVLFFLFIFALTFHKCQFVKKAILSFLIFCLFLKVCWAPRCSFFPSGFLCAFLFVFSLLFGLFWFPFWLWVLGAVLLFFPSGFLCAFRCFFVFVMKAILSFFDFWTIFLCFFLIFLFIFALTFHKCQIVKKAFLSFLFLLFYKVCWAPCCSFFRLAFCVRFCLCFLFFSGFFGFLFRSGWWAPCCSFFRRAFCVRLFVFSLLFGLFLCSFLALGAGRRAALFFRRAFCVRFCSCFFLGWLFGVPFWLWVLGAVLLFFP